MFPPRLVAQDSCPGQYVPIHAIGTCKKTEGKKWGEGKFTMSRRGNNVVTSEQEIFHTHKKKGSKEDTLMKLCPEKKIFRKYFLAYKVTGHDSVLA